MNISQQRKITRLLTTVLILIIFTGVLAFQTLAKRRKKEGKDELTLSEFFGVNKSAKDIAYAIGVGMTSGFVFGLIDNGGLFFGMDALEPLFEKYFPDGQHDLVKSGLGNTFSDAVGGFMGTFVGTIVQNVTRIDEYPFWAEAVGLVLGCLVGVYLPWTLMKKTLVKV